MAGRGCSLPIDPYFETDARLTITTECSMITQFMCNASDLEAAGQLPPLTNTKRLQSQTLVLDAPRSLQRLLSTTQTPTPVKALLMQAYAGVLLRGCNCARAQLGPPGCIHRPVLLRLRMNKNIHTFNVADEEEESIAIWSQSSGRKRTLCVRMQSTPFFIQNFLEYTRRPWLATLARASRTGTDLLTRPPTMCFLVPCIS